MRDLATSFDLPFDRRRIHGEEAAEPFSVLVVDDDPNYRAWLARLIDRMQLQVVEAEDGEEAVAIMAAVHIDLLLLDRNMPRMNGLETLDVLRRNLTIAPCFAVMLTGWDSTEAKIEALDRGFDDFLSKNAREQEIVAKLNASRRIVARHQALNLENRALYNLSIRDPLTGLFNRRYFDAAARATLQAEQSACIVIIDLDHFKAINDTWGHLMGDEILRGVGEALQRTLRYEDLVARYGGDEFVALLPRCDDTERASVIARIGRALGALRWPAHGGEIAITASIGVATTDSQRASDLSTLLAACDKDLYRRKRRARRTRKSDKLRSV